MDGLSFAFGFVTATAVLLLVIFVTALVMYKRKK